MSGILSNVFICKDDADFRIWKPTSLGVFSLRSFATEMEVVLDVGPPSSLVWLG